MEYRFFSAEDYHDSSLAPLCDSVDHIEWSFYRALFAEFIATLLFFYVMVLTVIDYKNQIVGTRINYQQKRSHFSSFSFASKTEIGESQLTWDHTQMDLWNEILHG